jgi:hypothetical protein
MRRGEGQPYATLDVRINRSRTFRLIIHTGATRTVITPRVQQVLTLEVRPGLALVAAGVTASAGRALLGSLEIEGFEETRVENLQVRVVELPFGDGALGLDYPSHFAEVCYSFATSSLRLTSY